VAVRAARERRSVIESILTGEIVRQDLQDDIHFALQVVSSALQNVWRLFWLYSS